MKTKSNIALTGISLLVFTFLVQFTTAGEITYFGRAHEQYQGESPGKPSGTPNKLKVAGAICTWLERNDYTNLEVSQYYGDHNTVKVTGSGQGDYDWHYKILSGSLSENRAIINDMKNVAEKVETKMRGNEKHSVVFYYTKRN